MSNENILIVEDEFITSVALKATIEAIGYQVVGTAACEDDAFSMARDLKPDLILMDIVLKEFSDGIEAAKKIKASLDIPVVYITAHASPDTVERAKVTEPFGYIIKPFADKELFVTIKTALYKHKRESMIKNELVELETMVDEFQRINKLMSGSITHMSELKKKISRLETELSECRSKL